MKCFIIIFSIIFIPLCNCKNSYPDDYMRVKADWIKTCEINKPNFTACSTESMNGLIQQIVKGIDGFKFSQIDPLTLNRVKILQSDGPVSINSSLTKAVVTGFSKMVITESKVSPIDYSWDTKFFIPKIRIEGQYDMNGRILLIPLNGRGKCFFEPSNMKVVMSTKIILYERDGHTFCNVTSTNVDYTITRLRLRLNDIFPGAKALDDSINAYLNENWMAAADALKPVIKKTIEDILLKLLKKVWHFIPGEFFVSDIAKPSELYG